MEIKTSETVLALRIPDVEWDSNKLQNVSSKLAGRCKFDLKADNTKFPKFANCVTYARKIVALTSSIKPTSTKNTNPSESLKKFSVELPVNWIGNLPKMLKDKFGAYVVEVPLESVKCGDILFLNGYKKRKVSHVVVAAGSGLVTHCSEKAGGAVVESIQDVFKRGYGQIKDPDELINNIDPRDRSCKLQTMGA